MTVYIVTAILTAITSAILGFFVLFNNTRSIINKTWFALSASVALWSFFLALMFNSKSAASGLFYSRMLQIGAIFIPPTCIHFVFSFLSLNKNKIVRIFYAVAIFLLFINLTPIFVKKAVYYSMVNCFYPQAGFLYILYILFYVVASSYTGLLLFNARKREKGFRKNQISYALLASLFGFIGGFSTFPLWYQISIPPLGLCLVWLYVVMITIAVVKHRLMDIEVIIRETAVFAGIFGFSIGLFILALAAGEQALQPYIGSNQWIVPAVALLLVTFALKPIERFVYSIVGKYLFKRKYRYQKILQDAAAGMATVRDPKKLVRLIVHIISMKMKLNDVSILIYDSAIRQYVLKATRGTGQDSEFKAAISKDSPLVDWLIEKRKPLTLDEIRRWTGSETPKAVKSVLASDLTEIEEKMKLLGASICVPSFFREELLGILVLGEKKSGDFFSQDDLDLFSALADEAAIALKNSQLYFEIDKKAQELEALYKREHRLFMHASVAFAAAIDARDPYTHGHSERVTNYSLAILDHLGVVPESDNNPMFRQRLQVAAVLHDIGKIGVPDDILHKPSKLNPKEQQAMEKHPVLGADIVTHIKGLRDLVVGIKHHHERYDGKGYPDGLKSGEIPFMAKIIAVADTYDAMTSDRPYRKGLDSQIAKEEIQRNAATQFDPYMVAAFLKACEEGKIK